MTHHWPERLVRAFGMEPWFVDPARAMQIVEALCFRAENGLAANPSAAQRAAMMDGAAPRTASSQGGIAVIPLNGTIAARVSGVDAMSGDFASLDQFAQQFSAAAERTDLRAIVLSIDSPGGTVSMVPETAAMIREARREGRPIIAHANTYAASAAYWIASAADEIIVSPSGGVGSIGVYVVHQDIGRRLDAEGVKVTIFSEGARKVENNPFGPPDAEGAKALQTSIRTYFDMFVRDVATGRGVAESVVRADPEDGGAHFGGGRCYDAETAVRLGMADRVESIQKTLARLAGVSPAATSASARRRKLATI